jgi:tungstate transport system ATP-binding protein
LNSNDTIGKGDVLYRLNEVRQEYNGRTVLDVDQLEIHRGEILALVGPSGAGKSTLLRLLNFLEPPAMGEIRFDGVQISSGLPLQTRRRVTTVFQSPGLLKRTVRANISYGLKLRGLELPNGLVEKWLERMGMAGFGDYAAGKLSAGEAQRVALARALVTQPDVLLLDEPTANLDPYNVGIIEEIVREANREQGTTIVLVTHNVFQARRVADQTALLMEGRLGELADTDTFFDAPKSSQTAAFLRGDLVY